MKVDLEKIKELRERTGASIIKCREALVIAEGDFEKAVTELRKKGEASAAKKSSRETGEGAVISYIHSNGKLGVLVVVRCETDFVARNEEFKELGRDLAMHIAAMSPLYIDSDEIPAEVLDKERSIEESALSSSGKPKEIVEKIVAGKLKKFQEENSLLHQPFVKNPQQLIGDLIKEKINKLGENIKVEKFVRFEI